MAGTLAIPNTIASQTGPNVSAALFDENWTTIRDYVNNREIASGLLSARGAATTAGKWYFATDTGQLYFANGSAWTSVSIALLTLHCLPVSATFPASNFPQLVKNAGTNWTDYTLDFDQTTSEAAFWYFAIPPIGVASATIEIYSRQAAATSGTVGWTVTTLTRADGEAWDTAGNADTVTADTVEGTAGQVHRQSKALTITGWTGSEVLQVKIARDIADTVAEDAKFIAAVIRIG